MKYLSILLAMLVAVPLSAQAGRTCTVASITDGDTFRCSDGTRVRLLLVNTPEMGDEPFGALARQFTASLAPEGTTLELEFDVDREDQYGRSLAYVYLPDGRLLNRLLVRKGFAQVSVVQPNVRLVDQLRAAADSARREEAGLWSLRDEQEAPTRTEQPQERQQPRRNCHPSYPSVCIPPPPPDLDCGQISHRRFRVTGSDPHRFDGDSDGVGCESE